MRRRSISGFPVLHGQYIPLGRTREKDDALELSWSASGMSILLKAGKIVLHFAAYRSAQPVIVRLTVDGITQKFALGGEAPVLIFENISDTPHDVSLLRVSEGDEPLYLRQIELWGDEPSVMLPPEPRDRRLLFIGDSLTCGYGTDSESVSDTVFHTYEQDATHAFAYLTAEALDADYQIMAISGQGIVKNCHGEQGTRFSDFWRRPSRPAAGETETTGFIPDAVVINGGTNDGNAKVPPEEFRAGALALIADIRRAYPDARIVWFYYMLGGPYTEALNNAARESGERVSVCLADSVAGQLDKLGCNYHPLYPAQRGSAVTLTGYLRDTLGW